MQKIIFLIFLIFYPCFSFADNFEANASYKVCFTPGESCTDLIVAEISHAKKQVLVQAYSFTSAPISRALVQAHKRGVDVKILLDKSQYRSNGFSSAKYFNDYQIPVLIDYKPAIAHNKVMIIDSSVVITGSFNFTRAAQERNAENVMIITDHKLATRYTVNWENRAQEASHSPLPASPFIHLYDN